MPVEMADKAGYDSLYKGQISSLSECGNAAQYISEYEARRLSPYWSGGHTKGYVRGLAVKRLLASVTKGRKRRQDVSVLDAGCGRGELSVYLACKGFRVIGVDISAEGIQCAIELATAIDVADRCRFIAESLEQMSLPDEHCDFIIGHASLHHFIKYEGVANELTRVLKPGGEMFFADAYGENRLYHVFHNKERMARLGDVVLTKNLIEAFFQECCVEIVPTDWFVMVDKLLLRALPSRFHAATRRLSRVWWGIDRVIPRTRATLYLSGAVMTRVTKPAQTVDRHQTHFASEGGESLER